MPIRKVHIINCKKASIRRTPWIPWHDKEIVGIQNGVDDSTTSVSKGSTIEIDPTSVCYDWSGRKFYKVNRPKGWIFEGCIDYKENLDG